MKFQVIFTYDSEYEGYVAEVASLPGCVSQGKTMDEAITNIKDAIQGYLYVQEKHGNFSFSKGVPIFYWRSGNLKIINVENITPLRA